MQAINYFVIIEKIKEKPKTYRGLELTEDQNSDVRYLKGKIVSVGNLVDMLKPNDIIYYDKHNGHGIQWNKKLYHVLKVADIVMVE